MYNSSIQYNFISLYRNNSHCSVHSHMPLLTRVTMVNVTRSDLSKIHLSAVNEDGFGPFRKIASYSDFLECIKPPEVSENSTVTKDAENSKSRTISSITRYVREQNTNQQIIDSLTSAVNIQNKILEKLVEAKVSPISKMKLGSEYQIPTPSYDGLYFDMLLKAAIEGYTLDTILFIIVGATGVNVNLAEKYPSVFINIDRTIRIDEPIGLSKNNDRFLNIPSGTDIVSQRLILAEFNRGKFDNKIVFCSSLDQISLLPDQSYTILNGRESTFSQLIKELIPRLTNRFGYLEELYIVLAILIYNYSDTSLLKMNEKQRYDWLVGKLNQESK